jgi:7-carboxy-7-deazaguanine synthase
VNSRELAEVVAANWPDKMLARLWFVGGEPLLQMDDCLVSEFHRWGFEVAIETNGTILPPAGIDWICVSPKAGANLVLCKGNELKLVVPQAGLDPKKSENLEFDNCFLQPMDGPQKEQNTCFAVHYCLRRPQWRLSVQTHKFIGIR